MILPPRTSDADNIRLDFTLPGATYDAILDGFPGLAVLDGTGDLAGNALAVSLKDGVTEERAILELPLEPLATADIGEGRIASATLHFNIDDVLTTFGPGTEFDGTAAEHIFVATYAGDGVVDLSDFARGSAAGGIGTGAPGSITDASLRLGGAIDFEIDLTTSVKQLVASGATHVGIVLSTDDSPTGTSIDDRGDGGTGAPGSGGATMPYLMIVTIDATPTPAPSPLPSLTATAPPPTATPPDVTRTPTPTATPDTTPSPIVTGTPRPTSTGGPVATPSPVATTATPSPVAPSPQPSSSAAPTDAATGTPGTATPGRSATPGATATATPAATASTTPGVSPSPVVTARPDVATPTPRPIVTLSPTPSPTTGTALTTLRPDATGDQLVFHYDARDGFTTFLNLHNLGDDVLRVRVVLYDSALETQITREADLGPGATRTLDVAHFRAEGLPATVGAAFAGAIDDQGDALVSRALAGSFTVANLATGSAWGAPAAARRAIAVSGDAVTAAPLGATIDGRDIRLQGIAPDRLDLSVFYDPATLEPAVLGGNQIVLLSFDDDGSTPVAARTRWQLDARRADGARLDVAPIAISGVTTTDLVSVLGAAAEGASGSIQFRTADGASNRLIFFVESLGTFATGYLLPPVAP